MILKKSNLDQALKSELDAFRTSDKDYWSFRGKAARNHAHAYFQYPAMMVPKMQADLLQSTIKIDPEIRKVFDPFVGSGTALTESMMKGLDFIGFDTNPLAILLCRAKTIPFFDDAIENKLSELHQRVDSDGSSKLETTFRGWNKWFRRDVAIALSRLRRAIIAEKSIWARRFFWVALAETVRLSSNSRTSTFKLHIRPEEEWKNRNISPIITFTEIADQNLTHLRTAKKELTEQNLLLRGRYQGKISVALQDASTDSTVDSTDLSDLLITSPPYGDNLTTIPYGQHSYLPLQWIPLEDIDSKADESYLRTTQEIDSRSLGGRRALFESDKVELRKLSPAFADSLRKLKDEPEDRSIRVTRFCRDLNNCIDPIIKRLKPDAYMIWIVGNRKVAGKPLPLDRILSDLLAERGAKQIARIKREIPTKRMAIRNNVADTMGRETILVLRKG